MNLMPCCGQQPDYQVIGIGGDEYDQITCPDCQEQIMRRRDRKPDAEELWNMMKHKDNRTIQDDTFSNHPAS